MQNVSPGLCVRLQTRSFFGAHAPSPSRWIISRLLTLAARCGEFRSASPDSSFLAHGRPARRLDSAWTRSDRPASLAGLLGLSSTVGSGSSGTRADQGVRPTIADDSTPRIHHAHHRLMLKQYRLSCSRRYSLPFEITGCDHVGKSPFEISKRDFSRYPSGVASTSPITPPSPTQ